MAPAKREINRLKRAIAKIDKVLGRSGAPTKWQRHSNRPGRSAPKRVRRTGKDLKQFRKLLKGERKRGVPVAAIARKHGVSTAYIYQLS